MKAYNMIIVLPESANMAPHPQMEYVDVIVHVGDKKYEFSYGDLRALVAEHGKEVE